MNKKLAKFQTAVSICQFLCPGMTLHICIYIFIYIIYIYIHIYTYLYIYIYTYILLSGFLGQSQVTVATPALSSDGHIQTKSERGCEWSR